MREARRRAAQALTLTRLNQTDFDNALSRHYQSGDSDNGDDTFLFDLEDGGATPGLRDLLEDAEEAPVIQLVNQLLRRAVQSGASDLHIEPHENGLRRPDAD